MNFPSGVCEYCKKVFERPNKFRTETEAYHIYGCRLNGINQAIKNKEDLGFVDELINEVKRIQKVSSFSATKKGNRYNERMKECKEIINKLFAIRSKNDDN